jgi:protein TonB
MLAGDDPNPRWAELAAALRDAYIAERAQLVVSRRPVIPWTPFRPRSTPCPPPASRTSGRAVAALSNTGSLTEFYRDEMRRSEVQGTVMVKIRIDASGCVTGLGVIGSSGSDALDQAALRMAETQSFLAAERNGHAVPFVASEPINFKLSN